MTLCEEPHPEREGVLCDKPSPCWIYHANAPAAAVWDGVPMPVTEQPSEGRRGAVKARLAVMASRAR